MEKGKAELGPRKEKDERGAMLRHIRQSLCKVVPPCCPAAPRRNPQRSEICIPVMQCQCDPETSPNSGE